MENVEDILQKVEVAPDHPLFYPRLSTLLIQAETKQPQNEQDECAQICSEEFDDLSKRLDLTGIQESVSVRNVIKARLMATKLVGDDGHLKMDFLPLFIEQMKKHLYSLGPQRHLDAVRDANIVRVLTLLQTNKELVRLFSSITRPVSNRLAEEIIRDTLLLPQATSVTDTHVRRACLAAWLTMLRQSLGSCFATAPAIIVQQEQPEAFLRDLDEIMHTGCMKRTYAGKEHSVPMSQTWGNGDLRKPFFLTKDLEHNETKVWMSPGLIDALTEASIFPKELDLAEKTSQLKTLLQESLHLIEKHGHIIPTCAEELIQVLLLHHHRITQKQVDEYLLRPKSMLQQSGMVVQVQKSAKAPNPVPLFLQDFEKAKTAFKQLADNPLLKAWEFTLASFSEINLDFCRWNLYTSLGMNYDDAGGIGHCLYQIISRKVEIANNELKSMQEEYDQVVAQIQYLEGRAKTASTEKEIAWVKMEYQSRQTELYHIDQVRGAAHERATKIAGLHEFLMREYDTMFSHYFQEVYDADLHDVAAGPFDDSPAGFRLIYKHGRSNPSLWTRITSLSEFVEALVSFFTITEVELSSHPAVKGIENELSAIITQLVGHTRSDEFLESAFFRMARAHGVSCIAHPLENLDKVEKKPWVYTSGGSMSTLVSAYFLREEKPTEIARWVENETELMAFFIDTVKQLPQKVAEQYLKDCNKSMLIHSPTHAFLLKPGFFQQGWTNDMYTYSWIKHRFVEPALEEIQNLSVEEEMAQDIVQELAVSVPQDFRPRFRQAFERLPYRLSSSDFRSFVADIASSDRGLRAFYGPVVSQDEVDSILYSHLPYMTKEKAREVVEEVLKEVFASEQSRLSALLPDVLSSGLSGLSFRGVVSAKRVLEIVLALGCLVQKTTKSARDVRKLCIQALRKRKVLLQAPCIVADSNWVKEYFAFVVSPGSGDLELWSVDSYGVSGKPISYWKMWVNGSRKEPQWGIFYKPHEYVKNMLAKRRNI